MRLCGTRHGSECSHQRVAINRGINFHRLFVPEYEEFGKKRDKANKYFTTYVDIKWQRYLADRPILHSKLKALEKHVAPCEEFRINVLRTKFEMIYVSRLYTLALLNHLTRENGLENADEFIYHPPKGEIPCYLHVDIPPPPPDKSQMGCHGRRREVKQDPEDSTRH